MKLYQRLRQKRQECGLTMRELGDEMDIASSYLSDIEMGKRYLSYSLVEKFSKALKLDEKFIEQAMHEVMLERGLLPPELVEILKDRELYDWLLNGGYKNWTRTKGSN